MNAAAPALRKVLSGDPTLELRRRAERLLALLEEPRSQPPEQLRQLRALAVLEYAGTPDARGLLAEMAAGAPGVRLTELARRSLSRVDTLRHAR